MENLKVDIDHLKKSHWTEQELKNAVLLSDFIQHLMIDHDFDYVQKNFDTGTYIQHNRAIADGVPSLIKYVQGFVKRSPDYAYDVKHINVDGDTVIFQSHVTLKKKHRGNDKKGFNIIDRWKVENGKITHHWDSIQAIDGFTRFFLFLIGGSIKNNNGTF